ncbi:MAG: hypothetical protein AAGC96_19610 [Pseudomonadota bacterium]
MRSALVIAAIVLMAGCTTEPLPSPGQPGGGESFSGSVSAFRSGGDLEIRSNRGRTCWGTYRYTNQSGRGVFRCDDGEFGPFTFTVPAQGRTATGTVTLADQPYPLTIRS